MPRPHATAAPHAPATRTILVAGGLLAYFLVRALELLQRPLDYLDQVGIAAAVRAAYVLGLPPYARESLAAAAGAAYDAAHLPPFLYPPPALIVFAPLALIEPATWEVAASLLNAVLAAACGVLVLRIAAPLLQRDIRYAIAALYLCACTGTSATIWYGQVNLIALLPLLAIWVAMRDGRDRPVLVGAALALAVLVKTYPALFIPYLAARGRWRAAAVCCALLAAAAGISWMVLPSGTWGAWLTDVAPTGGYGRTPRGLFAPLTFSNQSLNGFAMRMFTDNRVFAPLVDLPILARLVPATGACALLAVAAAVLARSRRRPDAAAVDGEFSLLLALMFIAAPLSWLHHLVFVMPATVLMVGRTLAAGRPLPLALAGGGALVLAMPALPLAFGVPGVPGTLLASTPLFAVFGLFVWSLRLALGPRAGPTGT